MHGFPSSEPNVALHLENLAFEVVYDAVMTDIRLMIEALRVVVLDDNSTSDQRAVAEGQLDGLMAQIEMFQEINRNLKTRMAQEQFRLEAAQINLNLYR